MAAVEFDSWMNVEGRTATGQLVQFSGREEDLAAFREQLAKLRKVNIPETHKVNVAHGGYGRYSRYDIEQHKYAGGGGGYIEALEVKDSPDGRIGNVIHEWHTALGSHVTEFTSVSDIGYAFEVGWRSIDRGFERFVGLPGSIRYIKCGPMTPWFYAVGEQPLVDDYVFPDHLQQDPVYRFGEKFVLTSAEGIPEIKTCMGAELRETTMDSWSGYRTKYTNRVIYWDDGTTWDTSLGDVRPLQAGELWIADAMDQFRAMLAGRKTEFSLNFNDGTRFVGKVVKPKSPRKITTGEYYAEITFKNGETKRGKFDYQPTEEHPTVEQFLAGRLSDVGEIAKMTIRAQQVKGKQSWKGVFYS